MPSTKTEAVRPSNREEDLPVWSITQRLSFLYLASTATLLLLTAGFLYWNLKHNLETTRHAMLASKVEVIQHLLNEPTQADVLASEVEHEAAVSAPLRYYLRILEPGGKVLHETSAMDEIPRPQFPAPVSLSPNLVTMVKRTARSFEHFLLFSVDIPVLGDRRTLQIALDVAPSSALLEDYRHKLLVVLVWGLVFAAVTGVWIARRGMQPLVEITRAAQHVSASHLDQRIGHYQWPKELAELAAAFDAMLKRLEDSFTRLSNFSADLAHALRSPINNLRGEAEVALRRSRSPEEYQQILASALEEYSRLSRMIDGLLFLARAENPDAAIQRVAFQTREQIDAVREFYDALASEQGVEVTCDGEGIATGDPMLFRRAVSNLLANALRHTPARGNINISLFPHGNDGVKVTVRDSGSGIPPEHLPRIFDRFYTVSGSNSHVPGGSGLGLAIVQSIMRLHGGTAAVESAPGQGTTVVLTFPCSVSIRARMTKL